jgi:hypothetical protein
MALWTFQYIHEYTFQDLCGVYMCFVNVLMMSCNPLHQCNHDEVDVPFKRADSDDWMKKSRWCSGFVGVKLTLLTSFHNVNAIVKQGRPKVTCSDNILSSGYSQKMAPTCAVVVVVQDSISLVNGQASTKNGVDSSPV